MKKNIIDTSRRNDRIAELVIRVGGVFVIVSVIWILVMISRVALPLFYPPSAKVAATVKLPAAISAADSDEAFVIGGAELYATSLPLADCLQLTEIDDAFDGDTHFPAIDPRKWRQTAREPHIEDEAGFRYAFVTYQRS